MAAALAALCRPASYARKVALSRERRLREGQFTADDGAALSYRHWPAPGDRALIVFPWGDARYALSEEAAERFAGGDCHVFTWDARGKSETWMTAVRDAERFARHVQALHGIAF